eukprot:gnl/Dysnectes_brevis/337_a372_7143.p1 GENE.gnl/Dysnectes_brevis/337_a372_7143~~gnl/Dysnectes_brevis/337_a372_7143.p1  ORF type:complete len:335 (+),score=86.77 gnl/Dysnectes_brevis/337_a372_7143:26-1030(+)
MIVFYICLTLLFLLLVFYIYCKKYVVIVPHGSTALIERLGVFRRQCKPGIHLLVPFIDHCRQIDWRYLECKSTAIANREPTLKVVTKSTHIIDLRETVLDFGQQPVITKDNVPISIDAVLFYRITDPRLAVLKIRNLPDTLELLTQATLRNICAHISLDDSFSSREYINSLLIERLRPDCHRFGAEITRVEVQNILLTSDIKEAMETQLIAERTRRAQVLRAEGERDANITRSTGHAAVRILQSEGEKAKRVINAKGKAEARILTAQAEADSVDIIRAALEQTGTTVKATEYLFAIQYLNSIQVGKQEQITLIPSQSLDVIGFVNDQLKGVKTF